jgi:amino acid transporter
MLRRILKKLIAGRPSDCENTRLDLPPRPFQNAAIEDASFLAGERAVEEHSAELRKELSLLNLVFTQVLAIVGLAWIGSAGKLGASHLVFWLSGILLFYIPSAIVVIHLNNEMPLEGGLYQWAKLRFNEGIGFLVACNLWFYNIIFVSEMGLLFANNLAYIVGPSGAWMASSKPVITAASLMITGVLILIARVGLALGKWVHGLAGFMIMFLFAAMACFAIPRWFTGVVAHPPLALSIPAFTMINLNILGRMGFGAMGGFDTVAIFAGECRGRDAAATIRRSVWIATPLIAGAFILGTACLLVFVRPAEIDLISPITQVLNSGMQWAGFPGSATSLVGTLIVLTLFGQALLSFNASARLPLVAGWDHLLPSWFTRLHPKHRTPVGSITLIGGASLVIGLIGGVGAGNQEGFQILQNASGIAYGMAYLTMFAIPLVARGERVSWLLRGAAASGFGMTLLNVVTSIFPIINVQSPVIFALKISVVIVGLNVAGALFYVRANARRKLALKTISAA